jgi:YHS domain-containing protein
MKRILICAGVLLALLSAVAYAATGNVDKKDMVCMMKDKVLSKPGLAFEYNGKTYYICCENCREKMKDDPAAYTQAVDAVSGEKVDKADALIYGVDEKAYYFASEANRKAFAENPSKYLKK